MRFSAASHSAGDANTLDGKDSTQFADASHTHSGALVAQGDKVVTQRHDLWRVKATDGEWESDFAHLFSVRDGRVTRFHKFTDADAFSRASGEG